MQSTMYAHISGPFSYKAIPNSMQWITSSSRLKVWSHQLVFQCCIKSLSINMMSGWHKTVYKIQHGKHVLKVIYVTVFMCVIIVTWPHKYALLEISLPEFPWHLGKHVWHNIYFTTSAVMKLAWIIWFSLG